MRNDSFSGCEYIWQELQSFLQCERFTFQFFLKSSLSIQLNSSWSHYLGVMPVSITQWRLEIGIFYTRLSRVSKSWSALLLCNSCTIAFYFVCYMVLTLIICGDVELSPGPENNKSSYNFSLCYWNLNSLPAHDFSKLY